MIKNFAIVCVAIFLAACDTQDIGPAHKGQMLDRTGLAAFYTGGEGLTGPVLGSGTYYTGFYDEIRVVDCSQETIKEEMSALTKDGVQFTMDVYIRYSANCSDDNVKTLLKTLHTTGGIITTKQLYSTYIRPALGEAIRVTVSPYKANDINEKREEILATARTHFEKDMGANSMILVQETALSNMDYPEAMDVANTDRAVQAVLKDKAIAEREKVEAEIKTAELKEKLASQDGKTEAAKIDEIGAALKRNPQYVQLKIYEAAGAKGNLIIAPSDVNVLVSPRAQ